MHVLSGVPDHARSSNQMMCSRFATSWAGGGGNLSAADENLHLSDTQLSQKNNMAKEGTLIPYFPLTVSPHHRPISPKSRP